MAPPWEFIRSALSLSPLHGHGHAFSSRFCTSLVVHVVGSSVMKYLYFDSGCQLRKTSVALRKEGQELWSMAPWPIVLQFTQWNFLRSVTVQSLVA